MTQLRRIYHITHVNNLPGIVAQSRLFSDAVRLRDRHATHEVGMSNIKNRRLRLPVAPHPGTHVGDYVPFYFCPRSIMLFVLHRANHPELTYRGGQGPIVHLSASLDAVIDWADHNQRRWAFTFSNAGACYARCSAQRRELDELDWTAIASHDFRDRTVKEAKQAEFLMHEFFPFKLFDHIAVQNRATQTQAQALLSTLPHCPQPQIRGNWYY